MKRDELGIPVLDAEEVEQLAARFLSVMAPAVLRVARFTPLAEIMTKLTDAGHCTFSFDEDLGRTPEGYKYLGYYDLRRRHVAIDSALIVDDPRFSFTVAHEIGHFYLHGKIKPEAFIGAGDAIRDSTRDLVTHRIEATKPRSLVEWQANRFAASILMPRSTVGQAVEAAQKVLGISRRGIIWLDKQPANINAFGRVLQSLSSTYMVSKSVVRYLIRELGLVHEDKKGQFSSVGSELQSALAELFKHA